MLPRRLCDISVRFISKSFVLDKTAPLGVLSKKKSKEIVNLDTVELEVEKDANKLVNYVCGTNLLAEGGENVKIKSDSEYPSWLKEIGKPIPFEQMDPNSKIFWKKLRALKKKEAKYLKSLSKTGSVHK